MTLMNGYSLAMRDEAACMRCGGDHLVDACPQVKAIEFDGDGNIRRLEFMTPRDLVTISEKASEPERPYPRRGPNGIIGA